MFSQAQLKGSSTAPWWSKVKRVHTHTHTPGILKWKVPPGLTNPFPDSGILYIETRFQNRPITNQNSLEALWVGRTEVVKCFWPLNMDICRNMFIFLYFWVFERRINSIHNLNSALWQLFTLDSKLYRREYKWRDYFGVWVTVMTSKVNHKLHTLVFWAKLYDISVKKKAFWHKSKMYILIVMFNVGMKWKLWS